MSLKLDENLGATCFKGLRDRGHEVDTVSDEGMSGAFDADVLAAVGADRALVTLDLDFSNPFPVLSGGDGGDRRAEGQRPPRQQRRSLDGRRVTRS
ncbi:MAG TPA: DUF5615 family PIN-like protein [Acidimicrobiales bacterium]|nr:DUF5615 family PIN-like protein [Acidimicrobiales bacterium]